MLGSGGGRPRPEPDPCHRRRGRGQEVGRLAPSSQRGPCPRGEMSVQRVGVLLGGGRGVLPLVCHVGLRRVRVSADVRVEWPDPTADRRGSAVCREMCGSTGAGAWGPALPLPARGDAGAARGGAIGGGVVCCR